MVKYPRHVWLVRHAEREDNINHNWKKMKEAQGLEWDNPFLSERGRRQAKELGQRFKDKDIAHIFASPLDRTIETGSAIAEHNKQDLNVKPEAGLIEALYLCCNPPSFWESDKLVQKYPLVDIDYLPVFSRYTLPKEGPGDDECIPRLRTTIDRVLNKYEGNIVFVGHGASIGSAIEVLTGRFKYVGQATVSEFIETGPGCFRHNFSSDSSHLSDKSNLRPY